MSTATPTAQLNDVESRDARLDEVFAAEGYAKADDDGNIVRDRDKVIARITAILTADAVAEDTDERLDKALSRDDLYPRVFPNGPPLDDPDELEREVAHVAAVYIWTLTQPNHVGRVQLRLADTAGATDLVLCRRKIGSTPSVYLTRNHDLIIDDYVTPASEKVVKTGEKYKKDMNLVVSRQPKLEARVTHELAATAAKTSAALGVTPSLESGRP